MKRMRVTVQRQWLLQYPDGRVAFFVINPKGPPLFVPVLRVVREREAWMNMRLTRRGVAGKNEPEMHMGGRYNTGSSLLAEYDPKMYIGGDNNIFWKPMSWAIIYGLTFATFLTLVIVPVMMWYLTRANYKWVKRLPLS